MKRLILLLCFGLLYSLAGNPHNEKVIYIENKPPINPYETLWDAMSWVESSNDSSALNRLEMAFGVVQIRKVRIMDYNKRSGKRHKLKDCYNIEISKEVWYYYATKFYPLDYEGISKAWNGAGKSNKIYWAKIKKQLELKNN